MPVIIEEFDSTKITNASIQFIKGGVQEVGTKFGCIGSLEGETELKELMKLCEGVEVKRKTKPIRMTFTVEAHIPVAVIRDIFGLKNKNLKPGVYSYGTDSASTPFVFTADVVDEFEDITKLIAFANCTSNTGFQFTIENGEDEVAQMEVEIIALPDDNSQIYYEALIEELEDPTIAESWHRAFTPELVEAV